MQTSRVKYERKPEVRLKRYLKNHDPAYKAKRRLYSKLEKVQERRNVLNKRRRQLCTTLITMAKQGIFRDSIGSKYSIQTGRLIRNDRAIIKVDKQGNLHTSDFDDPLDLENSELDEAIITDEDKKFLDLLDKYQKGEWQFPIKEIKSTTTGTTSNRNGSEPGKLNGFGCGTEGTSDSCE